MKGLGKLLKQAKNSLRTIRRVRARVRLSKAMTKLVFASPVIATALTRLAMAQNMNISITPTAPPSAGALNTLVSYMWWIIILAGVGIGGAIMGYKFMVEHNMEEGKKALFWTITGVVGMEALLYLVSHI